MAWERITMNTKKKAFTEGFRQEVPQETENYVGSETTPYIN